MLATMHEGIVLFAGSGEGRVRLRELGGDRAAGPHPSAAADVPPPELAAATAPARPAAGARPRDRAPRGGDAPGRRVAREHRRRRVIVHRPPAAAGGRSAL